MTKQSVGESLISPRKPKPWDTPTLNGKKIQKNYESEGIFESDYGPEVGSTEKREKEKHEVSKTEIGKNEGTRKSNAIWVVEEQTEEEEKSKPCYESSDMTEGIRGSSTKKRLNRTYVPNTLWDSASYLDS